MSQFTTTDLTLNTSLPKAFLPGDKAANYAPREWTVTRLSPSQYEAVNRKTGRWMLYTVAWGRIFSVASDSGTEYELVIGCCCCPDAQTHALKQGRLCAHAAGAEAVESYLEFERRATEAAAQVQAVAGPQCAAALAEVAPLAGPVGQVTWKQAA